MPANNETTTKFKVDISDLKKNITEANRQIKLANAEFKAAASGMDDWSKSADGVTAKINSLKTVLNSQNTVLDSYKKQLELIVNEYGENSKEADNMRIKIANQQTAVNNTTKELKNYEKQLEDIESEQSGLNKSTDSSKSSFNSLKDTISDQERTLKSLKEEYASVVLEQGKNSDSAKTLSKEITDLSGELNDNKSKMEEAESAADSFDKSLDDVGESAEETTNGGLSVFTVALGNLVANVLQDVIDKLKEVVSGTIEVGMNFETSMSKVAALSGATDEELKQLKETAKEFGSTTKFSASEAADALGYMALAGWDANTSCAALGGVLDLAAASGMDLAEASDIVTDYMSAFGMEAENSAYFADVLAYAQANANTTVEGLAGAFKNCAANMSAAGQDFETTTALLSSMANNGLKAEKAGTALSAIMRDITKNMEDGAIYIGNTAVAVMDAEGNFRDLTDILADVDKATQGMGDAEKAAALQATFTSDSIKGLNVILNAGVDDAADFEEQLRNSTGAASDMADIMNDNLSGDMTMMKSNLESLQIELYEKFEPALRKGVEALNALIDVIKWVVDHGTEFIAIVKSMAVAIGTYVAYTTAMKVMEKGWTSLTIVTKAQAAAQAVLNAVMKANPIGLVIAAIAGLVTAFVTLWKKSEAFRDFWIDLWEGIKLMAQDAWEAIKGFFEEAWTIITTTWETLTGFFEGIWEGIKAVFSVIADWINTNIFEPIKKFFQGVVDFFATAWESIKSLGTGAWNAIKTAWSVVSGWFDTYVITPVREFFSKMWEKVSSFASDAWEGIKSVWNAVSGWFDSTIIQPIKTFFSGMWDGVKTGASDAWEGIKSAFSSVATWFHDTFHDAWEKVKDVFSTGGKIFAGIVEGISDVFKSVVNAIIKGINKVIAIPFNTINGMLNKIRNVSILGYKPFSGLWGENPLSVPQIPELAQGIALARKGHQYLLEGNDNEMVIPLAKNAKWIKAQAQALKKELQNEGYVGAGSSSSLQTVNNNYNFTQNNTSPKALSRLEIYRQTKNQLNFAKGV